MKRQYIKPEILSVAISQQPVLLTNSRPQVGSGDDEYLGDDERYD